MRDTSLPANPVRASDEHVAVMLAPTAAAPDPARRVGFCRALFLYWLVPGRLGPHLAVGTWKRALGAHVISLLVMLTATGYSLLLPSLRMQAHEPGPAGFREALAECIVDMALQSVSTSWNWVSPLVTLGVVPLIELIIVAGAILAMPWCAGGDNAGSVFRRSLKNTLWMTTILIPGSLLFLAVAYHSPQGVERHLRSLGQEVDLLIRIAMLLIIPFVILRMLIMGARRYVGEPAGPAFSPREPLCDGCGYRITGLPLTGRCPECGLPVGDSLPGGRRRTTGWARNELSPWGFRDLVRLQGRIVLDPSFFETLPVQAGHAAARHFWWGTFMLIVLASLILTQMMQVATQGILAAHELSWRDREEVRVALLTAFSVPFVSQAMMLFVACLWAQFRLGIRDYRVSATVCYYVSPLIWPMALIGLMSGFIFTGRLNNIVADLFRMNVLGMTVTAAGLLGLVMALLAAGSLLYWWLRLCRALRAVRYANV